MYAVVDLGTSEVVPQRGRSGLLFENLGRVDLPNGDVVLAATAGWENGEFRIAEVVYSDEGDGPNVVESAPAVVGAEVRVLRSHSPLTPSQQRVALLARIAELEAIFTRPRFVSDLLTDANIVFDPATGQTVGQKRDAVRGAIGVLREELRLLEGAS